MEVRQMRRKQFTPEKVIGLLRQAEVELAQGKRVGEVCRILGISEQSYYRWRSEYGGLKLEQARRMKDLEKENCRLKKAVAELDPGQADPEEAREGLLSLNRQRQCVLHLQQRLDISERRACRTIGQPRSTQRKPHRVRDDEAPLTAAIIQLASAYGRYGYRRVTALLRAAGWRVNRKRVLRIWAA